jgi:hypothetical protein
MPQLFLFLFSTFIVFINACFLALHSAIMIEEIIPALRSHKEVKMLSAESAIIQRMPAIDSKISFLPFVNFLKEKLIVTSGTRADFYRYLIRRFEEEPALLQQATTIQMLNDHEELLELLSTVIFPVVSEEDKNNFNLSVPYQFNIFSYSESFKALFVDKEERYLKLPEEISEEYLKQIQCSMVYDHVLEKYYGIKLNERPELVYPVTDFKTSMKRYFRMRYDRRFIDVHAKGELPPIQDCAVCLNTFRILDLEHQLKTMPLELFEVEGFAVWIAEDVTTSESLERIKKILLRQDDCTENIKELKNAVLALVGLNKVEVGLMPFVKINNNFLLNEECTRESLIGAHWRANDERSVASFHEFINFQKEHPEPMPITNVSEEIIDFATFLKSLHHKGTRSYVYYPMQNNDGLLGMLELASPVPNQFTHEVMARLEPAIPLLSVAMLKSRNAFNSKIDDLVKEKFTALQPSVEWKFSEVAWDYLKKNGSATETAEIIFENVYPLYGAIDIRNSSIERNHAIQKDLKEHLNLIDETLDKLQSVLQLTLLEELKFKNENYQQSIESVLLPEDEIRITEFLENEVEPVFIHLQKNPSMQMITEHYFSVQKDCSGSLYHFRNEYEKTLASINKAVVDYLEEQEDILQKSYPHYFEKYRTDGVEYNIYIGQSMAPSEPFDLLYLKNTRLWQLKSMAEVARITHQLLPQLNVPLQTTQLILIHHQPIAISFRKDERRFDVEGNYNIRYEIMKKRIDKACIKDTNERLTQPGKISMVYCNQKEAHEYEEYIQFLQSKNLLKPGVENLDLEEMQGLRGMKALRVTINLD